MRATSSVTVGYVDEKPTAHRSIQAMHTSRFHIDAPHLRVVHSISSTILLAPMANMAFRGPEIITEAGRSRSNRALSDDSLIVVDDFRMFSKGELGEEKTTKCRVKME